MVEWSGGGTVAAPSAPTGRRRVAGLDGLRAVAVTAVFCYHAGIPGFAGGMAGVDLFFVLSGFLITSLLLEERRATGRIRLGSFYARRAKRLLPALCLMLIGVAVAAAVWSPATLSQLRGDSFATLAYVANWHLIATSQGYFAQSAAASPLIHTWSLAIEEQFYLLWPLLIVLLIRWRKSPAVVLGAAVGGALASAVAARVLFTPFEVSRDYYGTDTRAQALLVGAALAAVLALARRRERVGPRRHVVARVAGLVAAGLLAADIGTVAGNERVWFGGGLLAASVGMAALIWAVAADPSGPLTRLLSVGPVRKLGEISYGVYLWHWPVIVFLTAARLGFGGVPLDLVRAAVAVGLAAVSFALVEQPIRLGSWRRWRLASATGIAVTCSCLLVTTAGAAQPVSAASAIAELRRVSQLPPPPPPSPVLATGPTRPGARPFTAGAPGAGDGSSPGPTVAHTRRTPPMPPLGGQPPRMILVGDSLATFLGFGLVPEAGVYGFRAFDAGIIGCGLAVGGPVMDQGAENPENQGISGQGWVKCAAWPRLWRSYVARADPQVAVMLEGPWEVCDREFHGRWVHLGDPGFDAYEEGELEQAVDALSSQGARVVFLTSPYYDKGVQPSGQPWPQDSPSRVRIWNSLLADVARRHPGVVTVLPFGAFLSPGNHFSASIDGVEVRSPDGVHFTIAGGQWIARWLYPRLTTIVQRASR